MFAAVNSANAKLSDETHSRRWISLIGVGLCLAALGSLFWQTTNRSPRQLWIPIIMIGLAFIAEATFRVATARKISLPKASKEECTPFSKNGL
jgi:hypothetical protein